MSSLTPYICVADAKPAIAWYAAALGAEVVVEPIVMEDGHVGHCELGIGDARWMMSDEYPAYGVQAPAPDRGACVTLHLRVDDCHAAAGRVIAAGVGMTRGPEDSPPAGRVAGVTDPSGHHWFLNQSLPEG